MTRVNLVIPDELFDQHLMAEYREIPMVLGSLRRSLNSPNFNVGKIPKQFTLNSGHVMFFYNKLGWLKQRYELVIEELIKRRYNVNPDNRAVVNWNGFPMWCYGSFNPTDRDVTISRERINMRVNEKKDWYRKTEYK